MLKVVALLDISWNPTQEAPFNFVVLVLRWNYQKAIMNMEEIKRYVLRSFLRNCSESFESQIQAQINLDAYCMRQ